MGGVCPWRLSPIISAGAHTRQRIVTAPRVGHRVYKPTARLCATAARVEHQGSAYRRQELAQPEHRRACRGSSQCC